MMAWNRTDSGLEGALARTFAREESELLWLAYLLTGDRQTSMDAVVHAMDTSDAANPFFRNWMISWSRKLVIAKALGSIEQEMGESVRRARERQCPRPAEIPTRGWSLNANTDKAEIERALLAIDLFPRCAVLLTVFEKVSLDDAAVLLSADRETVKTAKAIGLAELTWNLARAQRIPAEAGILRHARSCAGA